MGADVEQRMDELLTALDEAAPQERKQLTAELSRLNRQKVLAARREWDRDEWMPLPTVSYNRPGPQPEDLGQLIKFFLRVAVGGADEIASTRGGELQFVSLFLFNVRDDRTIMRVACSYEEPIMLLRKMGDPSIIDDPRIFAHLSRDLQFK